MAEMPSEMIFGIFPDVLAVVARPDMYLGLLYQIISYFSAAFKEVK